ncbi:MAG: adenine-specific methyltransferase EcoRI family protein [Anaerolineae bacterium]
MQYMERGPLNQNFRRAKAAKNDEFYTQYNDIQREIGAYLEYNPDVFRGKVVYCNCDDPFESNFFRFFANRFKEYGIRKLIATSYAGSPIAQTQLQLPGLWKIIRESGSPEYGKKVAFKYEINEIPDHTKDGVTSLADVKCILELDTNASSVLYGDECYPAGDFRSQECIELLQQSDIVITNPPFSLFREYITQLFDYHKNFVILSNKNALTYKEVFRYIKENRLWAGTMSFSKDILFIAPGNANLTDRPKTAIRIVGGVTYLRSPSIWLTNLDHGRRHQSLSLMTMEENFRYSKHKEISRNKAYYKYDNYDAIEVPFTDAIPSDYDGVMAVPISFLDKYNPEQFIILGITQRNDDPYKTKRYTTVEYANANDLNARGVIIINGRPKAMFARILIKHRGKIT